MISMSVTGKVVQEACSLQASAGSLGSWWKTEFNDYDF